MSAIERNFPTPQDHDTPTPAAAPPTEKKKGFFNKIATLLHIRPKAPSSPEVLSASAAAGPIRERKLTRVPSDSDIPYAKAEKEKERDAPGTVGPSRTANRLSIHLRGHLFKDPPEVDRSLSFSQSTPTSPLVAHLSTQQIQQQLPTIYELLLQKLGKTALDVRFSGSLLIRDTSRSYQWIAGKADDRNSLRIDAVESILLMVYNMLMTGFYTFSYVKKEILPNGKTFEHPAQEISILQLTTLLFDNKGTREIVYEDKKRGLKELWLKILFCEKYQRDRKILLTRLEFLKATTVDRTKILAAVIDYQKNLISEQSSSWLNQINDRIIDMFGLTSVFTHTDVETVKKIMRAICQNPESVIGFTTSSSSQCSFVDYFKECQKAYLQFCKLLIEIEKEDPGKKVPFLEYFISRSQDAMHPKDWLSPELLSNILKASDAYKQGAYKTCFDLITASAEKECSNYDADFDSILYQIAERGLFILDKKQLISKEELGTLTKELHAAKKEISLIVEIYEKIAAKLK